MMILFYFIRYDIVLLKSGTKLLVEELTEARSLVFILLSDGY